ncbi:MAG TPA: MBL fold metallo-hydrolase, partial [Gammaproteobacteria bacterium]|nr:MBL fold metallo-hydrolase [Gammaproteobacteria bacterium]
MITNSESGTNVHEVAERIYRINTPVPIPGVRGGFNFNQYLILDDEPMVFHAGPRRLFPLVSEAVASVVPLERLRYVAYSHFEADECGALNAFLAAAPDAEPVCGRIAAMVSGGDFA